MSGARDLPPAAGTADAVLVAFARRPDPGHVKTRLARTIGDEPAAHLYAAFVEDLRHRFAVAPFAVRWAVAPPEQGFAARFALDPRHVFAQRGEDLGMRMSDAFRAMLEHGFTRCAIVGTDMPQLSVATVADAFARLDDADLVLGPAEDGGYYLIAARAPLAVFDGITWGSPDVLAATLSHARALGLSVSLLAPDFDVDEAADLVHLESLLSDPKARDEMPSTAAMIRALRGDRR